MTTTQSFFRGGLLLFVAVVISFVLLFAISREREPSPDFVWLETADPVADFRRATATGDLRFIGIPAGALSQKLCFPGAEPFWKRERIDIYGARKMHAPVFCLPGPNPDLDLVASYAERYNTLLRHHLEK